MVSKFHRMILVLVFITKIPYQITTKLCVSGLIRKVRVTYLII